jgi:RhoGAP domain
MAIGTVDDSDGSDSDSSPVSSCDSCSSSDTGTGDNAEKESSEEVAARTQDRAAAAALRRLGKNSRSRSQDEIPGMRLNTPFDLPAFHPENRERTASTGAGLPPRMSSAPVGGNVGSPPARSATSPLAERRSPSFTQSAAALPRDSSTSSLPAADLSGQMMTQSLPVLVGPDDQADDGSRGMSMPVYGNSSFASATSVGSPDSRAKPRGLHPRASRSGSLGRDGKPRGGEDGAARRRSGSFSAMTRKAISPFTMRKAKNKGKKSELERLQALGLEQQFSDKGALVVTSKGKKKKSTEKEVERLRTLGLASQYSDADADATARSSVFDDSGSWICSYCAKAVAPADRVVIRGIDWHHACWEENSDKFRQSLKGGIRQKPRPRMVAEMFDEPEPEPRMKRTSSLGSKMIMPMLALKRRNSDAGSELPPDSPQSPGQIQDVAALADIRSDLLRSTGSRRLAQSASMPNSPSSPATAGPIAKRKGVFGRDLEDLIVSEGRGLMIPRFVELAIQYLLHPDRVITDGLFRVSAQHADLDEFVSAVDAGGVDDLEFDSAGIHTVAGALKKFLRDLPNPLCTFELYTCFIAVSGMCSTSPP